MYRRNWAQTHARVRDGGKLSQFSHHNGKPRDLMLYDESLVTTDSVGLAVRDLRGCIGFIAGKYADSDKHGAVLTYLRSCLSLIEERLAVLSAAADASTLRKNSRTPAGLRPWQTSNDSTG